MADPALKVPPAETRPMTLPAFLDWDDGTDTRYELVRGQIRPMAPTTLAHAEILSEATNICDRFAKLPTTTTSPRWRPST